MSVEAEPKATTRADGKKAAAAKKKPFLKSKKGILLILAVVLVASGAYKFLMPKKVGPATGGDVVALDATTLNLAGGHYLKVAVAIQLVQGKASAGSFQASHAENLVIDEFSDRTVPALSSNSARQALATDLQTKLEKAYPGEIYDVFLTQFVTQ